MNTEMKAHTIKNETATHQTTVEEIREGVYQIVVFDVNQAEAFEMLGTMAATAGRIGAHVVHSGYKEADSYLRIQITS